MSLGIKWPYTDPGERFLSYKIYPLSTYSICYWEVCINFSGGEGRMNFLLGRFCTGKILHGEKKRLGVELFRENFTPEEFSRIPIRNFFMSYFLFTDSITREDVKGNCPG